MNGNFDKQPTVGKTYIIDKEFSNHGEVICIKVYGKHYCRVKSPDTGYEWDIMQSRLYEITE